MKWAKRIGKALAATIVLAAALQLAAPRAVHSAVAALVSVVGNVAVTNPLNSSGGPQPLVVQDVAGAGAARRDNRLSCEFEGVCSTIFRSMHGQIRSCCYYGHIGDLHTNSGVVGTSDYRVASRDRLRASTPT